MALSTSPASPPSTESAYAVDALARFYAWHAPIYDWTRPFILRGRRRLLRALAVRPGEMVLDVGCGTGYSLARLVRRGASVAGIDCSPAMLARARRRVARSARPAAGVIFDERPYGSHADYAEQADAIVFSYSLSMIPPFAEAVVRAQADLRPGGRVGVVDFLAADNRWAERWLTANHVHLGEERLRLLQQTFPRHRVEVRRGVAWRYFLFQACGE
jgi:S-adenosylmethionine-diacylgycerolhomoserine-N-methlytransferase